MVIHQQMGVKGLENHAEKPYRVETTRTFNTEKGISEYIKDFKGTSTRVFADLRQQVLSAIFDYHGPDGIPGWCKHVAELKLLIDPDYATLHRLDKQWLSQEKFVREMTDLAALVTSIDGQAATKADFVELVRDLKGMTTQAAEGTVSNSSVAGSYSYSSSVKSSKGELPGFITMKLPVFLGEDDCLHPFRIEPKNENGINLRLVLIRPEKVREEAFRRIAEAVHTNGGVKIYGL